LSPTARCVCHWFPTASTRALMLDLFFPI
jgi:hypothetical protein